MHKQRDNMSRCLVGVSLILLLISMSACSLISQDNDAEHQERLRIETTDASYFQYDFDITGDTTNDVQFTRGHWTGTGQAGATSTREASISPVAHTADCCRTLANSTSAFSLTEGFIIGDEVPYILDGGNDEDGWAWYPTGTVVAQQQQSQDGARSWTLDVPEGDPVYVGLRVMKAGAPHYAWLQVSVERTDDASGLIFVVHDYAVAPSAGVSIRAGQHP